MRGQWGQWWGIKAGECGVWVGDTGKGLGGGYI